MKKIALVSILSLVSMGAMAIKKKIKQNELKFFDTRNEDVESAFVGIHKKIENEEYYLGFRTKEKTWFQTTFSKTNVLDGYLHKNQKIPMKKILKKKFPTVDFMDRIK